MRTSPLLLLLLASACLWQAAHAQANCNLRCWIRKLEINIAELPEQDGASVRDMRIYGLDLGALGSAKPTNTSFRLQATGLAASISLHLKYTKLITLFEGDVTGTISQSSADATIALGTSSDGLLDHTTLSSCAITIHIDEAKARHAQPPPSPFSDKIINAALDVLKGLLQRILGGVLCDTVLPPLVDKNLSAALANFSGSLRPYLRASPRAPLPAAPDGMRSMRRNALVDMVDWALGTLVGTRGVNWVVGRLTNGTGVLRLADINAIAGTFLGSGFDVREKLQGVVPLANMSASIAAGLTDVSLQGLATWDQLRMLLPDDADAYTLHSRTGLAHLVIDAAFFVNVSTGSAASATVGTREPAWLYERGGVHVESNRNRLEAYMRTLVNTEAARSLDHEQLTDRDCLMAAVQGVSIDYLHLNASLDVARLLPLSGDIEADLDQLVSDLADTLIGMYKPVVPAFLNGVLVDKALGFVNPVVVGLLADRHCAVADKGRDFGYNERTTAISFVVCSLAGAALVAVCVVLLAVLTWRAGKGKKPAPSEDGAELGPLGADPAELSSSSAASSASGGRSPAPLQAKRATLAERFVLFMGGGEGGRPCLMCDPRINVVARAAIPLVLLLDIALFVSSNTGVGASVVLRLEWQSAGAAPHAVETPALFSFGLVDSIRDMWKARVYPLSVLIAVFSGAWPYIKLVAALACWAAPSQALNARWRGRVLVALDALGKWSLLDAYVMTIMIVSFHFAVPFGSYDASAAERPLALAVDVLPCWGFVTFLIATIVSLVTSHVVLYVHHRVAALDAPDPAGAGLDPRTGAPARCAVMLEFLRGRGPLLAWGGRAAVSALMLVTVALVVAGAFVISIAFEFRGAAGVALESLLNTSATREYSLVDVGVSVPDSSPEPRAFGPVLIVVVYLLTALIIPVLHMLAMLGLWCAPLTLRQQRWGMTAVEVCNAWSCIDVYIVSMAAALLEIRQFAGFMVGDKCDGINRLLRRYFAQDLRGHDICFEVVAKLTPGSWPLIVSIFFYFACTALVMRVCHRVIQRRLGRADDDCAKGPAGGQQQGSGGRGALVASSDSSLCSRTPSPVSPQPRSALAGAGPSLAPSPSAPRHPRQQQQQQQQQQQEGVSEWNAIEGYRQGEAEREAKAKALAPQQRSLAEPSEYGRAPADPVAPRGQHRTTPSAASSSQRHLHQQQQQSAWEDEEPEQSEVVVVAQDGPLHSESGHAVAGLSSECGSQ
eukprot:m51a1_g8965 hypothetical protein (1234) ;mRNA; r:1067285-1071195